MTPWDPTKIIISNSLNSPKNKPKLIPFQGLPNFLNSFFSFVPKLCLYKVRTHGQFDLCKWARSEVSECLCMWTELTAIGDQKGRERLKHHLASFGVSVRGGESVSAWVSD